MPNDPLTLLAMIYDHPATWLVLATLLSLGFGAWVRRLLRRVGVTALEQGIRWSYAVVALATVLATTLLYALVAASFGANPGAMWFGEAFSKALSLVPALLLVSGAGWYRSFRQSQEESPSPALLQELRWVELGAALLAGLSLVNAPMAPVVAVMVGAAALYWFFMTPNASGKLAALQKDLAAGSKLRDELDADATVELDGEQVSVIGRAGLLETDVLTDEGVRTVSNDLLRKGRSAAAAARRIERP